MQYLLSEFVEIVHVIHEDIQMLKAFSFDLKFGLLTRVSYHK